MNKLLTELQEAIGVVCVKTGEPMSLHTSMQVGGDAEYYLCPDGERSLIRVVKLLAKRQIPCCIVGKGTNIIVRDGGVKGAVVEIGKGLDAIGFDPGNNEMTAGAGAALAAAAKQASEAGLSGLEPLSGIPGTIGGALYMNAGAYGGEMSGVVLRARVYDSAADTVKTMTGEEMRLGYRSSVFQTARSAIILSVTFGLRRGDGMTIKAEMRKLAMQRNAKQPMDMPSAGSFFKRPVGAYAGVLIEEAGLKGLSSGGAQVSEKHAGFIVNTGKAKAADVLSLMRTVQESVRKNSGYDLEPEPRIIGEDI
ncbi:MAG: UDP-N-acetylmuramate dehydrogenase [Clostridiales Family XIII bacterium]|jgi:UDP-N-acetylmuramate dehydrogenase|nr:UDP-N-acetylmuramate dehydrogenase [Clostridiales Family XIII bacterium]